MKFVHALFIATGLCFAAGAHADDAQQKRMQPSTAAKLLLDDDPAEFVKAAASAGMLEIEASKLALERSQNPQVRSYAQMMIDDHRKADAKLKTLAQQKNITVPTEMMSRHQMMLDRLRDKRDPAEFDTSYQNVMVVSHKEAVSLFDEVQDDAKDADIRAFAAETLPTLQKHGGKARALPGGPEDRSGRDAAGSP